MPPRAQTALATSGELLSEIARHYLESGDFNGLPVRTVMNKTTETILRNLISSGKADLVFGDRHPNPHIKALEPDPKEVQLRKMVELGLENGCLYPSKTVLASLVKDVDYSGRPFTHKLARGEPQLKFYPFDLRVLEHYRRDPRYIYWTDDISGNLSVSDKYYETLDIRESDQVFLQTFGFAHNARNERAVVVFLCYLSDLSPEHQQLWHTQILPGEYYLHPDYARQTAGDWGQGLSVFRAFAEELRQINQLAQLMGKAPLFRRNFQDDIGWPKQFAFLIRPTLNEFNDFVLVLDKMLSENINRQFFEGSLVSDEARKRGTIAMLEEWIRRSVRLQDPEFLEQMFNVFKTIRTFRQRPAHALDQDVFDQRFVQDQRWLMAGAYSSIRTLRMILSLHPSAATYRAPEPLNGVIWLF